MGRSPCCDENMGIKKGPWTPEEDKKLVDYVNKNGHGSWRALPKLAGLNRCGKSCRLRWANYLRPDIKRGKFSDEEEQLIIKLHSVLGNKWSTIAQRLPGRTDNEIKNYWNTNLRKKLLQRGIDPVTHRPRTDHLNLLANLPQLLGTSNFSNPMNPLNNAFGLQTTDHIAQLAKAQIFNSLLQVLSTSPPPSAEALKFLGLAMPPNHSPYNFFAQLDSNSFENLANFPVNFASNNQTPFVSSNTSSLLDLYQSTQQAQTTSESGVLGGDYKLENINDQLIWPTGNPLPALVLGSPECSTMNEVEKLNPSSNVSNTEMSKLSSSSTDVDAWGELESGDNYWKDILDQVSSPSWTIS